MDIKRAKKIEELLLNFHNVRQRVISKGKFLHPETDITFSQWVALEIVGCSNKPSINEISKALRVSSSAATQLINCLQKRGLVVRKSGTNDKRFSVVELSSKARKIFNLMRKRQVLHARKIFSRLTDRELKIFTLLIKKITVSV